MTLNGPSTVTEGAAVSVDPMTAMLPVAPDSVHSGVPPAGAGVLGQPSDVAVGWTAGALGGLNTSEAVDELAAGASASELQAAKVVAAAAAQAAMVTREGRRVTFTPVTLPAAVRTTAGRCWGNVWHRGVEPARGPTNGARGER